MSAEPPTREQLQQAVVWRRAFVERMENAIAALSEAEAGAPTSLENVQVKRASKAAHEACATARASIRQGEAKLAAMAERPT